KLNCERHVRPATHCFYGATHGGLTLVRVQPRIRVGDPSLRRHSRGFDGEQRSAREGQMTEVDQVPIRETAVLGGVLSHGGDHDAVRQRERADLDGSEKPWIHGCLRTIRRRLRLSLKSGRIRAAAPNSGDLADSGQQWLSARRPGRSSDRPCQARPWRKWCEHSSTRALYYLTSSTRNARLSARPRSSTARTR